MRPSIKGTSRLSATHLSKRYKSAVRWRRRFLTDPCVFNKVPLEIHRFDGRPTRRVDLLKIGNLSSSVKVVEGAQIPRNSLVPDRLPPDRRPPKLSGGPLMKPTSQGTIQGSSTCGPLLEFRISEGRPKLGEGWMEEFRGVQMLTTLQELVDPAHTALLIVGMQNDTCAPEGVLDKSGRDLQPFRRMIGATEDALSGARDNGVLVIFVQNYCSPDTRLGAAWLDYVFGRLDFLADGMRPPFTVPGTWGVATIDELSPAPNEAVVMASRSSAFFQTNLDQVLRTNGIKSLVCTGASTEGSIDSTVRDALLRDYYAVILEDCVTSDREDLNELALALLRGRTDVTSSAEVTEIWRSQSAGRRRL